MIGSRCTSFSNYYGCVDYFEALRIQKQTHENVLSSNESFLLGFEHPLIITLGKRGSREGDLIFPSSNSIPVTHVDRGGQATLHSEGQLVIYPIISLRHYNVGVKEFVKKINQRTVNTLTALGVSCFEDECGTGVFTDRGKISSVGLRIDQGVSRHGLSINIKNDLSLYHNIRTCGAMNRKMDSVANCGIDINLESVFNLWAGGFYI